MYRRYFPMVKKLIVWNGGSVNDAADLFQDALIVIYLMAKKPDFKLTSQFSSLLYGVCVMLLRNRWLLKHRGKEISIPPEHVCFLSDLPDIDFAEIERQNLFDRAFMQLGEKCRQVLDLFFQKFSMKAIAERLKFNGAGYARVRKHECLKKLIELIKKQPGFKD